MLVGNCPIPQSSSQLGRNRTIAPWNFQKHIYLFGITLTYNHFALPQKIPIGCGPVGSCPRTVSYTTLGQLQETSGNRIISKLLKVTLFFAIVYLFALHLHYALLIYDKKINMPKTGPKPLYRLLNLAWHQLGSESVRAWLLAGCRTRRFQNANGKQDVKNHKHRSFHHFQTKLFSENYMCLHARSLIFGHYLFVFDDFNEFEMNCLLFSLHFVIMKKKLDKFRKLVPWIILSITLRIKKFKTCEPDFDGVSATGRSHSPGAFQAPGIRYGVTRRIRYDAISGDQSTASASSRIDLKLESCPLQGAIRYEGD